MGWLQDAQDILKDKTVSEPSEDKDSFTLDNEQDIAAFKKVILHYYEDATDSEINKAIEKTKERFDSPFGKKEVINYIKQFLD